MASTWKESLSRDRLWIGSSPLLPPIPSHLTYGNVGRRPRKESESRGWTWRLPGSRRKISLRRTAKLSSVWRIWTD